MENSTKKEESVLKKLLGIFMKGVLVLAPLILTYYIIYKIYQITDGLFKGLLEKMGLYFPGLGALVTIGVIFVAGLLASNWLTNKLLKDFEKLITRLPLLGKIYGIIKDTINSFSTNKKSFTRLVMVNMPNEFKLLGFITSDEDCVFIPNGYVAVYLMQSMQWAGNLILVPEHLIEKIEVSSEEALKFIASAGLLNGKAEKNLKQDLQ